MFILLVHHTACIPLYPTIGSSFDAFASPGSSVDQGNDDNAAPKETDYTPQQGGSGSNSFPSGEAQYGSNTKTDNQYTAQNTNDNDNKYNADEQAGKGQARGPAQPSMEGVNKKKGASDYDGYEQGDCESSSSIVSLVPDGSFSIRSLTMRMNLSSLDV